MTTRTTTSADRQASSASRGFFQAYPVVPPAYTYAANHNLAEKGATASDDAVLDNVFQLYLPNPIPAALGRSVHDFARTCLDPKTLRLMVDCETNQPTLHPLTTFGQVNDVNPLWTSEGWRGLKDIQTRAGIVAYGYQDCYGANASDSYEHNLRVHQYALAHLWSPSCASVSCPAAMSDGAAMLLARYLLRPVISSSSFQSSDVLRKVLKEAYARLVSFDPQYAWTSGQWMTERPGGSDVSRTETLARLASSEDLKFDRERFGGVELDSVGMPLGPYLIDGFKWFSSATDADMAVLLAKTDKGLSAFYAPMKRSRLLPDGSTAIVMNGVRISRLKKKLGTKGLPTAELEITGMRGWLLGEEGKGVKEISAILNATRLWTASGGVGSWGRGLAVARAYSKVRKVKGEQILAENRQHNQWMAGETLKYRAAVHFAFLGVTLLGLSELGFDRAGKGIRAGQWLPKDKREAELLLRLLTPVMKAQCSLGATLGLRECMESLGGVGYCENVEDGGVMNIARLFRDSNVNSIWEGTTNILAEDFVKAAKGRDGHEAIGAVERMLERMLAVAEAQNSPSLNVQTVRESWRRLKSHVLAKPTEELLYQGREMLQAVQDTVCAALLLVDAASTQREIERVIADRWISTRFRSHKDELGGCVVSLAAEVENDRQIFLGGSNTTRGSVQPKL